MGLEEDDVQLAADIAAWRAAKARGKKGKALAKMEKSGLGGVGTA